MQKITNLLNRLEKLFFYGFLITFTLTIRKVLFFYPINGQFNEYTGIYLYLSDIFILLLIITSGISIIYNKIIEKSRSSFCFTAYLKQKIVIIPLLLVILSFISAFWSANWQVAIFRSIKLLEFFFLYLWVIFSMFHVEHENEEQCSTWNISWDKYQLSFKNISLIMIGTSVVQSMIGIWQFITQKSIGLIWLKESILSPDVSGVAKVVFNGDKYIRAYGLFPHPNILGGFLILSIILTISYFKMFHPRNNVPRGTLCGTSVEHKWNKLQYYSILGIQLLALFLTFSKSAWMGLVVVFACLWINKVSCGENKIRWQEKIRSMFHLPRRQAGVEHLKYFALLAGIVFLTVVIAKPNWYSMVGKSIEDRMFYLNVSRGTFLENPILGVGMGQYVYQLASIPGIQGWQLQPVHNVFLLILNELGIVGLVLFLWFVWETIKDVPSAQQCSTWNIVRDKLETFKAVFLAFLFIILIDHYFWDIQQGQIMLWLILGIVAGGASSHQKLADEN